MRNFVWSLWLGLSMGLCAQTADPAEGKEGFGKPALIATADLAGFDTLPEDRRQLIEVAIAVARDSPWLPYTPRGADPSQGGFDCSGAMYFVLRKAGLNPPRMAAEQLLWLKSNKRLHEVQRDAVALEHPSLKELRPGDLLFWGTPGSADDGAKVNITHVAMYLGAEKKDGRPVMINSTDGRSYRGTKANGYGVYDFRLPQAGAKVAFIGYGTPLGIAEMPGAWRPVNSRSREHERADPPVLPKEDGPGRRAVLVVVMKVAAPVTATRECPLVGNATGGLGTILLKNSKLQRPSILAWARCNQQFTRRLSGRSWSHAADDRMVLLVRAGASPLRAEIFSIGFGKEVFQ